MLNPVIELLEDRWPGRSIISDPLPAEIVGELIEAVRLTPSCANNQPWRYLFLTGDEALAKGREALTGGNRAWAPKAPLLVIGYSAREEDCTPKDGRVYHQFDLGMSAMNLMLAATHHHLAARPMAGFEPEKIRQSFGLAEKYEPLVMIAVGYPSTEEDHLPEKYKGMHNKSRQRKDASEIVTVL